MQRTKGQGSGAGSRKHKRATPPRTTEQFFAKSERSQETWISVTNVLSKMRSEGLTLTQAAKDVGVSRRTVTRLGGSALKKSENGRYSVKRSDQLLRVMKIPTLSGPVEIGVRGSKQASILGSYWAALDRYVTTGDSSRLEKFRGMLVKDASGNVVELFADLKELKRLGHAGVLSFDSLYARAA